MAESMLYLSAADVRALHITPAQAREAVLSAFRRHAQGRNQSLPKTALSVAPGHAFQAMVAADASVGIACVKWVATAPTPVGHVAAGTNGLICVSDYKTGVPLSMMDGNEITLIRTAAMSAAAAALMAPGAPSTIGLIGCGAQAFAHVEAFVALYPSLTQVRAFSRTRASAEKLLSHAHSLGLAGIVCDAPDAVLSASDVVVSMVPAVAGLSATLDARRLKPEVFVSAVDLGRSWMPASFDAFAYRVTDTLSQMTSPYAADGSMVEDVRFSTDLIRMAAEPPSSMAGRKLFCFRGFAIADLALAHLALSLARQRQDVGTWLPR